jgi:predicted DNA-binding mobile mystery protein A
LQINSAAWLGFEIGTRLPDSARVWEKGWDDGKGKENGMRAREKERLQRKLDREMQPFRRAGKDENPTNGLLRAVRKALRVPVAEIAGKMGVNRSGVFDLEARELKSSATLRSMSRMAEAMGCKLVYGIVPNYGETFEELAEERYWRGKAVDSGQ